MRAKVLEVYVRVVGKLRLLIPTSRSGDRRVALFIGSTHGFVLYHLV